MTNFLITYQVEEESEWFEITIEARDLKDAELWVLNDLDCGRYNIVEAA